MDHDESSQRYLDAMREEWEYLIEAAARRGAEGVELRAWIDGVVDAIDCGVGILEVLGAGYPEDWRGALVARLLGELQPADDSVDIVEIRGPGLGVVREGLRARLQAQRDRVRERVASGEIPPLPDLPDDEAGREAVDLVKESQRQRRWALVVWCVFRASPSGRVRELRNIHASENLAREYVAEHPIPAREGWLEVEDWLVADDWDAALEGVTEDLRASGVADLPEEELIALAEAAKRAVRSERRRQRRRVAGSLWYRDPEVHSGELCFSGTRVPVSTLLASLASGQSLDDYLDGYPSVARWKAELYVRGLAAQSQVPPDLLAALRPLFEHESQLGVWLIGANGWLSGDTPLQHLDEPELLLMAARQASEPLPS